MKFIRVTYLLILQSHKGNKRIKSKQKAHEYQIKLKIMAKAHENLCENSLI